MGEVEAFVVRLGSEKYDIVTLLNIVSMSAPKASASGPGPLQWVKEGVGDLRALCIRGFAAVSGGKVGHVANDQRAESIPHSIV